jgi:LuxR family transcriptional regulator, maltose regulon positive regulatory protein
VRPHIAGKLRPPQPPTGVIDRSRLTALIDSAPRVVLLVAPAGYGKTILAERWSAAAALPTAWISLDMLDEDPVTFWSNLIIALRSVLPAIDDEPELSLLENPAGRRFLSVLIGQIERSPGRATLVLDDLAQLTNRSILDGLALLVDRASDRVRLVITARADPGLPVSRWRAAGWVTEIREDVLRLDDDEALTVAATFPGPALSPEKVRDLNHQLGGWPIALQLALVSLQETGGSQLSTADLAKSSSHLADFLLGEILNQLPERDRDGALALSVVAWFDSELAALLAGPDAGAVVAELQRRRLLGASDDRLDARRFHPLLRELLLNELKWRDLKRYTRLHRDAAAAWQRRGDLNAAYHHLTAIGDAAAANALVLKPALAMLDSGDRAGLARAINSWPSALEVVDPYLAMDVASLFFLGGNRDQAVRWCDRAEELTSPDDASLRLRLHFGRATIALFDGDIMASAAHVAAFEGLEPHTEIGPGERRIPAIAAQVALERRDLRDTRKWLARMRATFDPAEVPARLYIPALEAQIDLLEGRLQRALKAIEPVCEWAERETQPNPGRLEAYLAASRCQLAAGNFAGAEERAAEVQLDAHLLGSDWHHGRAAVASAEVRMVTAGPAAALAAVAEARATLRHADSVLQDKLDLVEAKALIRTGRLAEATELLNRFGSIPVALLLRAEMALAGRRPADAAVLLSGSEAWMMPERLEAAVLASAASTSSAGGRMAAVIREAAGEGWVSPFLGHGTRLDQLLLQQPLEQLHPGLARQMRTAPALEPVGVAGPVEGMTARERTILELLPSHLSYAQIGTQLYLSVNTVKMNLKSIYRKLAVASRSEAVDAARAAGLL